MSVSDQSAPPSSYINNQREINHADDHSGGKEKDFGSSLDLYVLSRRRANNQGERNDSKSRDIFFSGATPASGPDFPPICAAVREGG